MLSERYLSEIGIAIIQCSAHCVRYQVVPVMSHLNSWEGVEFFFWYFSLSFDLKKMLKLKAEENIIEKKGLKTANQQIDCFMYSMY